MHLKLVTPNIEFQASYEGYVREIEATDKDAIPWVVAWKEDDFSELINRLTETVDPAHVPEGMVEHSTFWMVDTDGPTPEVVGVVNIRHRLNEKLLECGGHVGYSVRPSARRRGIGSQLLANSLNKLDELGVDRVLVCCDHDNVGSRNVIENNGGIYESDGIHQDGTAVRRYWISR